MKILTALFAATVILLTGADDGQTHSVLKSSSGPVLLDPGPVVTRSTQETVLEAPNIADIIIHDSLPATPTIVENPHFGGAMLNQPHVVFSPPSACNTCCKVTCCCKPATHVTTEFELIDPAGCVHVACAKVPVCCANEAPIVSWKFRLLGRQIATLCWACCDHEVKVVITRRGKIKVRD